MAKKDLQQQADVADGLIYNNEAERLPVVVVEPVVEVVEVVESTIHIKYEKYILQSRSNYINGIEYYEMMDMVNHIQKITGRNYPFNASCAPCIINMVKLFDKLR